MKLGQWLSLTGKPTSSILFGILLLVHACSVGSAWSQSVLPVAEDVDGRALRIQCQELLNSLTKIKAAFPPETERELQALLREEKISDALTENIQKLLNDQCLIGVSINPESRVKAARGRAQPS